MTRTEFTALARTLVAPGIAFRARPGPRTLKRCPYCTVVNIDLTQHAEQDMRDGLQAALRARDESPAHH